MNFIDWSRRYFKPDEMCQDEALNARRARKEYAEWLEAQNAPETNHQQTAEEKRVADRLAEMTSKRVTLPKTPVTLPKEPITLPKMAVTLPNNVTITLPQPESNATKQRRWESKNKDKVRALNRERQQRYRDKQKSK